MRLLLVWLLCGVWLCGTVADAQVLDKRVLLQRETFWQNRDWDWYQQNIPMFECPDADITTTWYYRWELLTRHLTYGSPNSGYSFTEFTDRPFWSGAYGAISCPAGHQLYEARWLLSPQVANDYSRYWFRTPGAQPRNYSTWLADAIWAVHEVHPDEAFVRDLLPDLIRNYEAWAQRHYAPEVGLFWQTGHDDGMEFNINSRQTKDILRGAPGFRPTINAYMFADARAIARVARLAGDVSLAEQWEQRAEGLRQKLQELLWDSRRGFFLQMYRDDEEREGQQVRRLTRTYESGQFAGSEHGRELIGYVPWQFGLPATDRGYEQAWKYLMDPQYFAAPFGPVTVERRDPQFQLQTWCCWWSGQSWPYATTQTLKALANVLQHPDYGPGGRSLPVTAGDYVSLLQTYAKSHRKDGQPYLAEALHPETGSFAGHDGYNHSEHYFHSGFCDLVVTGLVGVQPSVGDMLQLHPLAPESWPWFALDDVSYHGHRLTVLWDRDGSRYGRGKGLTVLVDGREAARSDRLQPLQVPIGPAVLPTGSAASGGPVDVNFAVNNDGDYYPRITATAVGPGTSPAKLIDGNAWYDVHPPNRWTAVGSKNAQDELQLDLGMLRPVHTVKLLFLDDGGPVAAPERCQVFVRERVDGEWQSLPNGAGPEQPEGHRASVWKLSQQAVRQLKIVMTHAGDQRSGLTELEVWGPAERPVVLPTAPEGNLAARRAGAEYPKIAASHTSRYDRVEMANDGRAVFAASPHNRWTSYESPNAEDWLELDFGSPQTLGRVEVLLYDDGGGVQAPESYRIEVWDGSAWQPVRETGRLPEQPQGGVANSVTFASVRAVKLRVLFRHRGAARSGVTELEVWER